MLQEGLQSLRARNAAAAVTAPTTPAAPLAPPEAPSTASFVTAEASAAIIAVKELIESLTEISRSLGPARDALKTLKELADDTAKVANIMSSGAAGKRWIPKKDEGREEFFARAKSGDASFDPKVWSQTHEAELRKDYAESFTGKGWQKKGLFKPAIMAEDSQSTSDGADA